MVSHFERGTEIVLFLYGRCSCKGRRKKMRHCRLKRRPVWTWFDATCSRFLRWVDQEGKISKGEHALWAWWATRASYGSSLACWLA
jgi:ribosomal protein L19E